MTDGPDRGGATALALVATTAEVLAHPELDEGLLAPWERRRLAPIRLPGRRADVLAARLLVRLCVARATGLPLDTPALAQRCPGCGEEGHGRPYLRGRPGTGVSLSHADGLVAAAAGPGAIGIDVEPATRRPGPRQVLRRLLPEADRAEGTAPMEGPELLRLWVRAEARLKAGGAPGAERFAQAGWFGQGERFGQGDQGDRDGHGGQSGQSGQSGQNGQGDQDGRGGRGGQPGRGGQDGRGGLRLLDWTDRPRAAVVAVAATTRVVRTSV